VEPDTWHWYERRVRLHLKPTVGPAPLARLTPQDVKGMHATLSERGVSPSEQHKAATTLRAALADAVKDDLLPSNPAAGVKKPKVERRPMRPLEADEARRFLGATRADRLAALYDLELDAGLRPGELFALHGPDVDRQTGEVFVHRSLEEINGRHRLKEPKTEAGRRRVMLAPRTLASLEAHRVRMRAEGRDVGPGPVFVDTAGGFLRQSNLRRNSFVPALKRADLRGVRLYDLRHTSATLLLASDVNVKVVSECLGHESIEITLKHYAHCLPRMQQKARDAVSALFGDCPTAVPRGRGEAGEVMAEVA
jgi:integrase